MHGRSYNIKIANTSFNKSSKVQELGSTATSKNHIYEEIKNRVN